MKVRTCLIVLTVLGIVLAASLAPSLADGGPNHRVRNLNFGVSGGNVNDRTSRFCCSGTLGALVVDNTGTNYILSNNHVLGRSDQAVAGEDVSQPGMIDANCNVTTVVADFTAFAPLGPSNVDAAIAQLRPGLMDATGEIEDIGVISSSVVAPTVGMSVAKSGRTTGFTTGSITSINTSVNVQYQKNCGSGKKFTVGYTNQIVISPGAFSAGGDSGSLIVTNNSAHNPVGLLFAGSSSATIANRASEVLTRLSAVIGRPLSFVGSGSSSPTILSLQSQDDATPFIRGRGQMRQLPEQASDRALAVLELHRANLMATPGVIGAGVGATAEDETEPAIVIYVDRTAPGRPQFAQSMDGIAVRVVLSDPFVAF
ncbi:MAG TPA: hypothetical protein VFY51_11480 [Pyrinomonadaceae bacterium]|nr:hypothetical protein [Pyrinomonadaceae bacterium]